MADLITTRARVFTCLSTPDALDRLSAVYRTAPDEAILVTGPDAPDATAADTADALAAADPAAIVIETTDGWEGLTLDGEDAGDVFAHLSELELPSEGFVQGDVGRLAAKVFTCEPHRITVLVPSPQAEYLRRRIIALGAKERREPEDWTSP